MSAQPVAFTNYHTAYDFTTGADKYSGGASRGGRNSSPGYGA